MLHKESLYNSEHCAEKNSKSTRRHNINLKCSLNAQIYTNKAKCVNHS